MYYVLTFVDSSGFQSTATEYVYENTWESTNGKAHEKALDNFLARNAISTRQYFGMSAIVRREDQNTGLQRFTISERPVRSAHAISAATL